MDWLELAACKDKPQRWFFPVRGENPSGCYERARLVCEDCPVKTPCLEYALKTHEEHGFWGGATPHERFAILRRRRRRVA